MNREQWDDLKFEDIPTKSLSDTPVGGESQVIKFDWEKKWLNGEEYRYILIHADLYCKAFDLKRYPLKTHPSTTYTEPIGNFYIVFFVLDGEIYFVEGLTTGSDFGFPRIEAKKRFRWYSNT